jgi:WXXGXW repeat (2 copies)
VHGSRGDGPSLALLTGREGDTVKKLISIFSLAVLLLTGGVASAAQVSVGVRIGPPPAPRVVRVVPNRPGPGYVWVNGYWYPVRGHYVWHDGYWTRPPYRNSRWISPRWERGQFYDGYWDRDNGRRDRDYDRRDRDRDRRDRDWRGDRDRRY